MSTLAALKTILFSASLLFTATVVATASAQDSRYTPERQQIPAPACLTFEAATLGGRLPCDEDTHKEWLQDITHWRNERRIRIGFDPARYAMPELKWAQSSFMQPQLMVQDRYFYDPVTGKYTVDRYLDDLRKRFGGIDSVLIWSTYPNMGIDNRNQLDMVRSMPGGVAGVRNMVADFHRRGVKVLFPMMMWDQGTRDEGKGYPEALAELMKEVGADGINGDTQDGVPLAFSLAAEKAGHPLAFQPENNFADEAISWDVMHWGQYTFAPVPTVDRFRWLEPRHQVNISDRWNHDKTDDLQFAFFNGEGWESWENIWGIWNGITPRDGEATRRVATIERGIAPFLVSQEWEPMYPMTLYGVFASRWPLGPQTAWTIVNRSDYEVMGRQMSVPFKAGERYFDLYHGVELTPLHEGDRSVLSFDIEAHGFAALLATSSEPGAGITKLMATMRQMTAQPLATYSHDWASLSQQIIPIAATTATGTPAATVVSDMVTIPATDYLFRVSGSEIEGRNLIGLDVQYAWENSARRFHEHRMQVASFAIDRYPVTNAEYKRFLDATRYHPRDDFNFLKDWTNGSYPKGWDNKPVTWVSVPDAEAYLAWAGKRLPHEWEWQLAAQGTDGRLYPWGNDWEAQRVPARDKGRTMRGPDDVNAHPNGASPAGVTDLVGNVWQWTDRYEDDHTRGAILRGGSYYQPQGTKWYFPNVYRNDVHSKWLMMGPSYDRSGAIGFRGVRDLR